MGQLTTREHGSGRHSAGGELESKIGDFLEDKSVGAWVGEWVSGWLCVVWCGLVSVGVGNADPILANPSLLLAIVPGFWGGRITFGGVR